MTQTAPPRLVYGFERPPRFVGLCLLAMAALDAAALLLWVFTGAGRVFGLGALLLWLLVAVCALRCWRRWPCGLLEWDGTQWWLKPCNATRALPLLAAPRLQWDGQSNMLLCVTLRAREQHWLWLQSSSAPQQWGQLRRAVYWRARPVDNA